MIFDSMSILAYCLGLVLIYIICRVFSKPLKWFLKLAVSGLMGGFILAAVNLVGGFAGMSISINPLSALITGVLGIPGIALIIILQYIL